MLIRILGHTLTVPAFGFQLCYALECIFSCLAIYLSTFSEQSTLAMPILNRVDDHYLLIFTPHTFISKFQGQICVKFG